MSFQIVTMQKIFFWWDEWYLKGQQLAGTFFLIFQEVFKVSDIFLYT